MSCCQRHSRSAVTVVGTAVLMAVAGLAAYQYRRRKWLELERRARLEREALEQLEHQRRLARLGELPPQSLGVAGVGMWAGATGWDVAACSLTAG